HNLLRIANAIPASLGLRDEVDDWIKFANAGINSELGTVSGLEKAIIEARKIDPGSPLYNDARSTINRWEREIEDVAHLERARQLASGGNIPDLRAAIAEARLIPQNNPRFREAQNLINGWSNDIKITEDRPFLTRANELASYGDINSLQRAIDEANLIAPGRPLHGEAQKKINQWRRQIETQQDQPYLEQANILASSGNYREAVAAAQQVRSGRALHGEAQKKIKAYQREINASNNLQQAFNSANAGTPDALAQAISYTQKIPAGTQVSSQSSQAANRWSYQILAMANERANSGNISEAINIARKIPSGTEAYAEARTQINYWQKQLNPPPPPPPAPAPTPTPFPTTIELTPEKPQL
ncbi:MAG: chromosome segregation ATPase, partial [Okeania sp. SIO2D1]|nr:chromosome segregation ATPase [Okeania sp. SIO2D1]